MNIIKDIKNLHVGKVIDNALMSDYTTYKVGGKVICVVIPEDEDSLIKLLKYLRNNNIKNKVLGNGSNVIFNNSGYDGVIIKLDNFNNIESKYSKKTCGICFDEIDYDQYLKIKLVCNHIFCEDCWYNYLKEKISNANVAKITCIQHGCGISINENFIKNILKNKEELFQKYKKFSEKQKILLSNKNIKFCPFPDCDGYAEKKGNNKYVKCNFGHDFCFECLNKPHGIEKCEIILDKEFDEWKSHKIVKRCPKCKIWTEKNEGCNHMTCVECKFQWCWLCQKEYKSGHYLSGSCKGLQFSKEQDEEKIKKMLENNLKNSPQLQPQPPRSNCKKCCDSCCKTLFCLWVLFLVFFGLIRAIKS